MSALRPPFKIHGGKWYLRNWVIEHFPANYQDMTYCELCCGGASTLLNKEPSAQEIINDIDKGVISVFKALRDEPKEFITRLKKVKYTERTFKRALTRAEEGFDDYIELALNEYTLRRMSRGGMKKAFAWSERERGGQPGDVNAWDTMIKQLPKVAARIKDVTILQGKFQDVLKVWDEENVLIYLDPPYLPSTRAKGSTDIYDNEMAIEQHIELLNLIKDARCKAIISGYASPIYNKYLKGWKTAKKEVVNNASQQKVKEKRTECLWMNY